ncbi:hypothetical protein [Halarcobacter sp.]|uniref:hypothetical protein n=1 Tax=Halarcobacter sp. TaxID=2321133 RepID=UPI0029F5005B|nr:hypothetical protein [Halarcobacter sp.]
MKYLIMIILISTTLLSHDVIDTSNINTNPYKCKKVVHWLKEPKKHDFYTNVDNYLVGVAYEQCDLKKKEFDDTYKFYALIKFDSKESKSIRILNGKYQEKITDQTYIERYKIGLTQFLYYYSFINKN